LAAWRSFFIVFIVGGPLVIRFAVCVGWNPPFQKSLYGEAPVEAAQRPLHCPSYRPVSNHVVRPIANLSTAKPTSKSI
jgi:hypothetical protein